MLPQRQANLLKLLRLLGGLALPLLCACLHLGLSGLRSALLLLRLLLCCCQPFLCSQPSSPQLPHSG